MANPTRSSSIRRPKFSVLTSLLCFLGVMIVVMLFLLSELMRMDLSCHDSSKDHRDCPSKAKTKLCHYDYTPPTSSLSAWNFQYYGPDPSIESYNPGVNPVFPQTRKLRVRLFTEVFNRKQNTPSKPMNECKHILYDGLLGSEMIDLVGVTFTLKNVVTTGKWEETWKDDDLWVLDSHHIAPDSCDAILKMMKQTLESKLNTRWMILAVDYGDRYDMICHCEKVAELASGFYRVAKRSIGMERRWNEAMQFPERGRIAPQPSTLEKPLLHLPYPVRTDVARGIADVVKQRGLSNPLDITDRQLGASHFYARQTKVETGAYYDNLRNGVNVVLKFLDGMPLADRRIKTFAGLAGTDKKTGRNIVSSEYVETMLHSKIIVVAQRDGWSDHYRLMEALSSGAMVICDETLILPRGLRHGESLVIFTSFSDLRDKLLYYIEHDSERVRIATRGWEIAMAYHRSWHAMEGVIFGKPVTGNGDPMTAFAMDLKAMTI